MSSKAVIFNRFLLCMSFALFSCASKSMLYRGELYLGGKKAESDLSILEIAKPAAAIIAPANLHQRSYQPSDQQFTWIASIDGEPITKFLGKGQDPRTIKRYHVLPGKHQIGLMFEGDGTSVRFVHMFDDSVRMNFEYHCITKEPVTFEINAAANERFLIETHAAKAACNFSVTKNAVLVLKDTGRLRYQYSNVFDPKNWHLNQDNQHHPAGH
ncbi:MAG: hypothetical protein ACE5IR_03650 [bacterium]